MPVLLIVNDENTTFAVIMLAKMGCVPWLSWPSMCITYSCQFTNETRLHVIFYEVILKKFSFTHYHTFRFVDSNALIVDIKSLEIN